MSNDLFGAVALLLIIGVGAVAFQPAFLAGADRAEATESVTVDYDNASSVSESGLRYSTSVDVVNDTGGELTAGEDYEWNETAGELRFLNTSATSDGGNATVTYQYRAATEQQRTVAGVINSLGLPLVVLLFLLAGGYVFTAIN
jgi:hypothetical protein